MSTPPFVTLPDGVVAERWPVRGAERAVWHCGLGGSRPWALLVPGFTGSKEDFIAVLPMLAAGGVGALSFDQLGQHESDGSDRRADYALDLLAADVADVADHAITQFGLATPPHLLGHSFGGLVSQEAVASAALRPASLVLLCSGPGALPAERWQGLPDLVTALDHSDLRTIWRIMREMEEAEDVAPPPPEVDAFLERRWHANHPQQLRAIAESLMSQPPITDRLRPMLDDLPVTVMWGEDDDAWPIAVQADLAASLGADAIVLPGVGHSPNTQDPAALVEALLGAWAH